MTYTVSLQRNPNLSIPQIDKSGKNEVLEFFGSNWWTGLDPESCPGFNHEKKHLQALPLLNLKICNRQDVLDYFNNVWTLTELLFASLKNESTYIRPPYHELRHPLIFYYGHPAVVYYNKMRLAGIVTEPIDLYLEKILETGVDEMSWDDMSKNEMQWPSVKTVHEYRQKIYNLVINLINTDPALADNRSQELNQDSPLWSLFMGFEHEKIHFETSSVLIRELPLNLVETPKFWTPLHPSALEKTPARPTPSKDFPLPEWKTITGGNVTYGKSPSTPSYGWDNEYGTRTKNVKDFQVTNHLVTNGEYFEFVSSLSCVNDKYWSQEGLQWRKFRNTKRPTFWVAHGPEGYHEYKLRTLFEVIDMPWSWPVEVNFHEAQAFIRWKNEKDKSDLIYRLITEPEHVRMRGECYDGDKDPVLQRSHYRQEGASAGQDTLDCSLKVKLNSNFQYSSANPVNFFPANKWGVNDVFGNVWQWTEDQFNPLDGFKVHPLYDDFSTPCFDGKHQMILGGSFISCGHEASKWARFHFRPHFFQHSGFRIAATLDGSTDNESTKLKKSTEYIHPRRQNILDQMQQANWWKNAQQPMEMKETELHEYWGKTVNAILEVEKNRVGKSPMGTGLDPATNDLTKGFTVPYQSVVTFPNKTEDFEKLLQTVINDLAPMGQQPGHPGYLAYVSGAGNAISNMAQALSQTLNQFTGHFSMSPGLVTIEAEALRWIINMAGFPAATAGGIFTTGASFATLSAFSIARKTKMQGTDLAKVRFYASTQAHHCIGKAISFLGFPSTALTLIPVNEKFQIKTDELEKAITADKAHGLQSLVVIGNAGTTNTGAVDNLSELAKTAKNHNMWFHIDGAYGGFFMLTEKGKEKLRGLDLADSVALDPHKSLSLPYGTGCLIVKDRQLMSYKFTGNQSYMPPAADSSTEANPEFEFADMSAELSRDFRGLRFWLPLKTWGVGPFQLNLEEKIELAKYLSAELKVLSDVEVITEPELSIVNFKLKDSSKTRDLLTRINQTHQFFLSGCMLNDTFVIRVCLLGFRCHFEQVQSLVSVIKKSLEEVGI
jgi:5-histidylcysteine sulfoxide synthase